MHTSSAPATCLGLETRKNEPALLGLGLFAAVLFSPSLLDVVLLANLGLLVAVALLHLAAASLSRARLEAGGIPRPRRWAREPFVSVHVPLEGAPPEQVQRTLEALRRLEWSAYEVLIARLEPARGAAVERLCGRLGPRFRLLDVPRARIVEDLQERGALDHCLAACDPRTELVLVVAPGTRVHPRLLAYAARYFDSPGVGHVQFAPADASHGAALGLAGERAWHRDAFQPFAEAAQAPLPHGTPCLVQRRALALVGGWRGAAPSEGADLGVRLAEQGFHGRFALEAAARDIMPESLGALREERRRRVLTQASALFQLEGRTLRQLGLRRSLAVFAQLTSSFDFLLLPALALPLLAFAPNASEAHRYALLAATAAFPLHLLSRALLCVVAPRVRDHGGGALRCLLARLGFLWEGSTGWIQALFGVRLASPSLGKTPRRSRLGDATMPLLVAAVLAVSSAGFFYRGQVGAALACALATGMFGAVLYVRWELLQTARWRQPVRRGASLEGARRGRAFPRARWSTSAPVATPLRRDGVA